jgi:hypothetical protein
MKIIKNVCAIVIAIIAMSCDKYPEQLPEPQDPNDISGMYNVNYRMWIDGTAVSFGELQGRVEVRGEFDRELSLDFYPDNAILKFPPWDYDTPRESLSMWPVHTVGTTKYDYTFDNYNATVSLEVNENHSTIGPLAMSGSIVAKQDGEWSAGAQHLDAGPGVYYKLNMTIDMWVPDPELPSGTQIYPETGEGTRKFHIEIMSK